MGRRYDESDEREAAAESDEDMVEEDVDDPAETPDDNLINSPAPPASKEYIDLELARVNPPA
jgi:hypothetical protein